MPWEYPAPVTRRNPGDQEGKVGQTVLLKGFLCQMGNQTAEVLVVTFAVPVPIGCTTTVDCPLWT